MAAFDFPSSPSVNQTYTANGVTWKWNGTMWMRITGAGYLEKIEEGNSKIEVDDSGSGNITASTDGTERLRITSTGWQQSHAGYAIVGINTFASWARTGGSIRAEVGYNALTTDYMYFGTGTNHPLALRVNNSNALYIKNDASRNVGIGTDNPSDHNSFSRALDINGPSGAAVYMRTAGSSTNTFIVGNYGSEAYLNNVANGNIRFYTQGDERLRIDNDGRLLLGLNSSIGGNAIFQVQGSGNKKAQFHQPDSGSCHIQFTNTQTGTSSNNGVEIGLGGEEQAQIWNYYNSYFRIGTNGSERLRITSDGNVLIGTNSGTEKLCIKRDDAVGPTITLENNTIKTYINNWGSSGPTGRTNRFEINATVQAQASICAPYITFMTGGAGDSNEKFRMTSDGDLESGNIAVSSFCNTHNVSKYSVFLADNHANTFFGQNLRLDYSGTSGNHQLKVSNQHAQLGGAGMLIGGNQSPNRNELNFYTVGANQPAGTRVDDTNKRLTIRSNGDITIGGTNSQYVEAAAFEITNASKSAIVSNNSGYVSFNALRNSNSTIISHDPNSNSGRRITFPVAGSVHFSMYQDIMTSGSSGYTQCRLYKNGTADRYALITYTNGQWDSIVMNTVVEVAANDYLEVYYVGGDITNMDYHMWNSYNFIFYPINTNRG